MHLQVVYCSHHTADLNIRERLAFATETQLNRAYESLRSKFPQSEAVVISTCNRVEVYTAQEDSEASPSQEQIANFFAEFHQVPINNFVNDLLRSSGPEAVRHLFEVASSLDSMVLGEPQIVNQIKDAYRLAQANDACGPLTCALFEGAIRVSKRVRTETGLERGRVSIASVAVGDFGKSIFDRFDDKLVLIIGAGEMAEETLRYLKEEGVQQIIVVNRNVERAEKLAAEWGGKAKSFEELSFWMGRADVIVSTTGAERPIINAKTFAQGPQRQRWQARVHFGFGAPAISIPKSAGFTTTCSCTTLTTWKPPASGTAKPEARKSIGHNSSSARKPKNSCTMSTTVRPGRSSSASGMNGTRSGSRKWKPCSLGSRT